jgi:hypothetical protein
MKNLKVVFKLGSFVGILLCLVSAGCSTVTSTQTTTTTTTTTITPAQITVTNTTTVTVTQLPSSEQPVQVVSVSETDFINPGGPQIIMTLKNNSDEPIISLKVLLSEPGGFNSPWTFNFNASPASPLLPGQSIDTTQIMIGGGWGGGISYSLTVSGTLQNGTAFSFDWVPVN